MKWKKSRNGSLLVILLYIITTCTVHVPIEAHTPFWGMKVRFTGHFDTCKMSIGYRILEKKIVEEGLNYTCTTLNCNNVLNNTDILDFQKRKWRLRQGE